MGETRKAKKRIRTRRRIRDHTYLGCPLTRNRSAWCFRLCAPNEAGEGQCGRVAPHSLKGEVARSIARFDRNERSLAFHCANLERMYQSNPCNAPYHPDVRVTERGAEIAVPLQDRFALADGALYGSVGQKLLIDAATLAVNSMVTDVAVAAANFTSHLTGSRAAVSLIARGRLLAVSRDQFLAESVLVDSEAREIGRGTGSFVRCDIALTEEVGYRKTSGSGDPGEARTA